MHRVLACVFQEHNLWLVALAALICLCACIGAFFVLSGLSRAKVGRGRWVFLAATLAGVGAWATHFVAMLGYDPGLALGFDLTMTLISAAVCVAGAGVALEVYYRFESGVGSTIAGIVLGSAIVAMHYIGAAGVHAGATQEWAADLVVASALFSVSLSIAALHVFSIAPMQTRVAAASALLIGAIVTLHFIGMGALTLVPDPRAVIGDRDLDRDLLALVVAVGAAAVLLVGVILAFADRRVAATELAAAQQAAAAALHDALTGLPNRRHLSETLARWLTECDETRQLVVVAVDLDRFKPVNDLYGHGVGDELLVKIAGLLREEAGPGGFVARLGGDEFVLIAPDPGADELIGKLSALVAKFEAPIALAGHEVSIGATLGVAMAPADGRDAANLMRRADVALYRAKEEGRGRYAFFEAGMDERVRERAAIETDLRIAIRNDEIEAHFQPFVELGSGRITGYEILARWTHAQRGAVEPSVFIKIAEETGLIGELGINVLRRACRESLHWPGAPRISLNVAALQLKDANLAQKLLKVLAECGFPAKRLEIEITEDALVADFDAARAILISLKNLGVAVALDDFGTGYSSLRHLRELPFDELKIDRSFVHSMGDSAEALSIVRTIVQLAKNLGLGVTAEGVETEAQARELVALGCKRGQGFLLGRPQAGPIAAADVQQQAPTARASLR
jgi:diguanylate cyclase (GGDEF)-like protein